MADAIAGTIKLRNIVSRMELEETADPALLVAETKAIVFPRRRLRTQP